MSCRSLPHEWWRGILSFALATVAACAHTRPPPAIKTVAELEARLETRRVTVNSYSAEVRLTYFGAKGRVRGTASLAVQRPAKLRYELMGPHGGAIGAFATNGKEIQAADLAQSRFVYGPATRDNLDQLFAIAPLHLDAEAWVSLLFGEVVGPDRELYLTPGQVNVRMMSLLFGEVALPDRATVAWDDALERLVATWQEGAHTMRVEVDANENRVTRATVISRGDVLTDIEVRGWDDHGLPAELALRVPATGDDVELKLRDVAYDPVLDPGVFTLEPPRGAKLEHL